jgi:hypothetical protein
MHRAVAVVAIRGTLWAWRCADEDRCDRAGRELPLGGVARDYLAYVDGFRRLGCDVLYLEDMGQCL